MHTNTVSQSKKPRYHLLTSRRHVPPFDRGQPADYIIAGDGILMRILSMGMLMDVPITSCTIRGLAPWATYASADEATNAQEEEGEPQPCAPCYHLVDGSPIPPLDPTRFYEYLIAGNGVFLRTERRGIEIVMPVSPPCELVGLVPVTPGIGFPYPRISRPLVEEMLARARAQTRDGMHYDEQLFYLLYHQGRWEILEPEQVQSVGHVEPQEKTLAASLGVWCEVHSHHQMAAFFSATDDRDEQWFGLYAELGRITTMPEIRLRIVVDGCLWPIPASWVYDLPEGVTDALLADDRAKRVKR